VPSFSQEEREMKDWICNHRQQGYVVTRGAIRMKAKQMINNELFHASSRSCHLKKIDLDISLILVHLICKFASRGLIHPRYRCILYAGVTYMQVYMVILLIGRSSSFLIIWFLANLINANSL